MKKELSVENYRKELVSQGFKHFGLNFNKMGGFNIDLESRNIPVGTFDRYYGDFDSSLHFVSKDYRITVSPYSLVIYDNSRSDSDSKKIFANFYYDHYRECFNLNTPHFNITSFIKDKNSTYQMTLKYPDIKELASSNNSGIVLDGANNEFKIKHRSVNLTSIFFGKDSITATFKSVFYSKIVFDYDFNIKEVEVSKNLLKKLNCNPKLKNSDIQDHKYYNIKNYDDLISKIKTTFSDNLDFYSLINDSNYKFKETENKFNRDLNYLRILTEKRQEIFNFEKEQVEKMQHLVNYFKNFISPFVLIEPLFSHDNLNEHLTTRYSEDQVYLINKYKNPVGEQYSINERLSNIERTNQINFYKMLSFLDYNKQNNIELFNFKVINDFKNLQKDVQRFMNFNTEAIKLKRTNNKTINK